MAKVQDSRAVQQGILQTLYALFLGGLLTALVVVGLVTFYPTPTFDDARLRELDRQEQALYACPPGEDCRLTADQEAELRRIQDQRTELYDQQEEQQQAWNRNASIVLIAIATGLLALSLIRWERAIVLSNGLLLGGLFTMVGGIGMAIAGGQGVLRFLVLLLAVAITVLLGYLRFARREHVEAAPGAVPVAAGGAADAALEGRVADLEHRLEGLRRALGG